MSQGAVTIADGSGLAVLAAINAANARFASMASGTSRPADIGTGELWRETDNPGGGIHSIWLYDGASDVLYATLNTTTHAISYTSAGLDGLLGSTKGMLAKRGASSWAGLAVGSAFQGLYVNSAGDDLEYRRSGWEKIAADVVPSGAASVDFTSIPSNVKAIEIAFALYPATDAVGLRIRASQSGSFLTGGSDYNSAYGELNAAGGIAAGGFSGAYFRGYSNPVSNNTTTGGIHGRLLLPNIQGAGRCPILADYFYIDTTNVNYQKGFSYGAVAVAGAVDGLRLDFTSGNVGSGRVCITGLRA